MAIRPTHTKGENIDHFIKRGYFRPELATWISTEMPRPGVREGARDFILQHALDMESKPVPRTDATGKPIIVNVLQERFPGVADPFAQATRDQMRTWTRDLTIRPDLPPSPMPYMTDSGMPASGQPHPLRVFEMLPKSEKNMVLASFAMRDAVTDPRIAEPWTPAAYAAKHTLH